MLKHLTSEEYKSTFTQKMIDVTGTAQPVVDIWEYVHELAREEIVNSYVFEKQLVEIVYRNQEETTDHVLLPTPTRNIFIVIVVDLIRTEIKGHFLLDLNKEYGISS